MVLAELPGVNLMLDNDTELMVSIFKKAFQCIGAEEHNSERYLKSYKSDLAEAGQIFAYLGLARPDAQSPLGWRPTDALLDIIAKRAVRGSKRIDRVIRAEESHVISLFLDAAFGEQRESFPLCAFTVLNALGLTRAAGGEDVPTRHFRQLFAEAYYDRQDQTVPAKK